MISDFSPIEFISTTYAAPAIEKRPMLGPEPKSLSSSPELGSLGELTSPLAAVLGMKAHDTTLGAGNAFNNLKAHEVTAGRGRISYVVRLVRKDVKLLGDQIREAADGGTRSTRRIPEFARFLPLLNGESIMAAGEFPWSRVGMRVGEA